MWKVTKTHDEPKLDEMNFNVEREAKDYTKLDSNSKDIVNVVIEMDYQKQRIKVMFNEGMNEMQKEKSMCLFFSHLHRRSHADLHVVANKIQIIQVVVIKLRRPPPEPPNANSHTQIYSRYDLQRMKENTLLLKPSLNPSHAALFAVDMKIEHIDYLTKRKNIITQILVAPASPIKPPNTGVYLY